MLLKELTQLNGISGNEDEVRDFIKEQISQYTDSIKVDSIGNLIAFKKGTKSSKHRVMLSAHMDEVGFMVIGYGEGGVLKFRPIGGLDDRILPGQRVFVGNKKIPGVIGCKATHLQEREERAANIKLKNLYIDIGADKKEEAEKLAPIGEYIAYDSDYVEFGDDLVKTKALDDRVGCAVLIEALKGEYNFDLYCCFTVQEEVGLRGAQVAAYGVDPHLALVLEGTTCSDVPGVEEAEHSTKLGNGAALTIMDRTTYTNKNLVKFLYNLGEEKNIKVQYKQTTTGGNDAGKIHLVRGGVRTAAISVPCRYIHSPFSVMSKTDYESVKALTIAALKEFNNEGVLEHLVNGGTKNV